MKKKELVNLIENGESLNVEFKQRFSTHTKIAKEIIAFANTKGGYLIFGVDDNKNIYGIDSEKELAELLAETNQDYCEPAVVYNTINFDYENRELLIIYVHEAKLKPIRIKDYQNDLNPRTAQVYVRVNDKSVPASKEMIKILQTESTEKSLTNYTIGKNEKRVFEFLDKNESITVKEFSKLVNISSRRASRTLTNLVRAKLLMIHTKDNGEDFFTYSG